MKILDIAFSNGQDDKKAWSGTIYKAFTSLRKVSDDTDFLPIKDIPFPIGLKAKYFVFRVLRKLELNRHTYLPNFTFAYRDAIRRYLKTIDFSSYDVLFTTGSVIAGALLEVLREKDKSKVVYLADAPFCGIEDYYPDSTNLYRQNSTEANSIGRYVFTQVPKIIVSSQWAKDLAVKNYGAKPSVISVIEFGANLDSPVLGTRTVSFAEKKELNILLSGVDWQRKGGGVAIACCQALIRHGYAVTLHIVGMQVPTIYHDSGFVKEYGFLNKNIPKQYQQYLHIIEQMDIFLFPSRQECSATVLCEAAGYGLPTFCYDTGGVGNYVLNDYNGLRLPLSATGEDFADAIINALEAHQMDFYSQNAQHLYQTKLNWDTWAERVKSLLLV